MSRSEQERKLFVEKELAELVKTADDYFVNLYYKQNGFHEYVCVDLNDGNTVEVNITNMSFMEMAFSVIAELMKHF